MKFKKLGQATLVLAGAFAAAGLFTACNPVTIDFVYVTGSKADPGQVETFEIDRVTGALSQIGTIVSSGGTKPVSMAISQLYHNVYVLNQTSNNLVNFYVNNDGLLVQKNVYSLDAVGNMPVSVSTNNAATLLFVVSNYQPGCTTAVASAATCNGGSLAVFPMNSDGTLGNPIQNGSLSYWPVGINPTAVQSTPNWPVNSVTPFSAGTTGLHVFVSTYDPNAGLGYVYIFTSTTGGTLTPVSGSPELAGVKPSGMAIDPTSRFVYITDFAQNELIAYTIYSNGLLIPLINGPFKTGNEPSAVTIDPRGIFLEVTNELDNSVSAYEITLATGTPTAAVNSTGSQTNQTATAPVAVVIDPGFGRYVITANYLDNSTSSFLLNDSTGTLSPGPNAPYPTVALPTAVVSVPRGNHAIQVNQP